MEVEKEINHDILKNCLLGGKRADGRQKMEYRQIRLEKNPLKNAEGSAVCSIGKTQVISAIKVDLAKPFADRPNEGILSTNCEFTPLGSAHFEPGPPRADSIELARVVDRGVRSSECINLKSLALEGSEEVLAIYIDLWVADHGGNLFDASMLATMAALQGTKMPKIEDNKIVRGEYSGNLELSTSVVSSTFCKIGNEFILDPAIEEEMGAEGMLTIATTPEFMCAGQKSGRAGFTKKDIIDLVDISFEKAKELRNILQA